MKKTLANWISLACIPAMIMFCSCAKAAEKSAGLIPIASVPEGTWQGDKTFPDQAGSMYSSLAMNSMYSFDFHEGQGSLYLEAEEGIESFDLFVNNREVNTGGIAGGSYELDLSKLAVNGTNTIQVTNITPEDKKITVKIPYPIVISGTLSEAGINEEAMKLIEDIIVSDIKHGFAAAQLTVIKDGRMVYQNSWGLLNSCDKKGNPLGTGLSVSNDTMFDLASNTKMYSGAYAIQVLCDRGELSLDDRVVDLLGQEFADETMEIRFASYGEEYPGLEKIREWKSGITVKNLLMHQAGFPDSGHYHNDRFDTVNQKLDMDAENVLYVSDATKEKTFREGICRTPLICEPGTETHYSDIDYMILGLIVEKVTGKDLNTFLSETFFQPMGLEHITYTPLKHGFSTEDCAATELNGNTRDGLVEFPGVRTDTIQGEVHDEESYYTMEGMSAHAGLFASAGDLAKLAYVMLEGGYGTHRFFSKDIRDTFISPQAEGQANYGIGWWREGDDRRPWYFGTQAPESTAGHQGWTGTLTMIDFENRMVIVYLTNSINSPIVNPDTLDNAGDFSGKYYTASSLGFVPQILYMGMEGNNDPEKALNSLIHDMVHEKQKLLKDAEEKAGAPLSEDHPMRKALLSLQEVEKQRTEK